MHADLILIILAAAVVLAVVYRGLAWVYLPPRNLPGSGGARRQLASEAGMAVIPMAGADGHLYPLEMSPEAVPWAGESSSENIELCQECLGPDGIHCDGGDRYCDCPCGWGPGWDQEGTEDDDWEDDDWELHDSDDEWADQLHAINQLGKFGDLTRPVAHLTHYEVEALIRTLAVPEWVPDRYRVAA